MIAVELLWGEAELDAKIQTAENLPKCPQLVLSRKGSNNPPGTLLSFF